MLYLTVKSLLSGIIVMLVSEIAKRSPAMGALVASLPLISILGIVWLWKDTSDIERIAAHTQATFWFVLPSLPMFLIFPALLRNGMSFWLGLLISCTVTVILYLFMLWMLPKIGIKL
jgi:hypothetical protein